MRICERGDIPLCQESDLSALHALLQELHREKVEVLDLRQRQQGRTIELLHSRAEEMLQHDSVSAAALEEFQQALNDRDSEILDLRLQLRLLGGEKSQGEDKGDGRVLLTTDNGNNKHQGNSIEVGMQTSPLRTDAAVRVRTRPGHSRGVSLGPPPPLHSPPAAMRAASAASSSGGERPAQLGTGAAAGVAASVAQQVFQHIHGERSDICQQPFETPPRSYDSQQWQVCQSPSSREASGEAHDSRPQVSSTAVEESPSRNGVQLLQLAELGSTRRAATVAGGGFERPRSAKQTAKAGTGTAVGVLRSLNSTKGIGGPSGAKKEEEQEEEEDEEDDDRLGSPVAVRISRDFSRGPGTLSTGGQARGAATQRWMRRMAARVGSQQQQLQQGTGSEHVGDARRLYNTIGRARSAGSAGSAGSADDGISLDSNSESSSKATLESFHSIMSEPWLSPVQQCRQPRHTLQAHEWRGTVKADRAWHRVGEDSMDPKRRYCHTGDASGGSCVNAGSGVGGSSARLDWRDVNKHAHGVFHEVSVKSGFNPPDSDSDLGLDSAPFSPLASPKSPLQTERGSHRREQPLGRRWVLGPQSRNQLQDQKDVCNSSPASDDEAGRCGRDSSGGEESPAFELSSLSLGLSLSPGAKKSLRSPVHAATYDKSDGTRGTIGHSGPSGSQNDTALVTFGASLRDTSNGMSECSHSAAAGAMVPSPSPSPSRSLLLDELPASGTNRIVNISQYHHAHDRYVISKDAVAANASQLALPKLSGHRSFGNGSAVHSNNVCRHGPGGRPAGFSLSGWGCKADAPLAASEKSKTDHKSSGDEKNYI